MPRRDSKPQSQQARDRRRTSQTAWQLGSALPFHRQVKYSTILMQPFFRLTSTANKTNLYFLILLQISSATLTFTSHKLRISDTFVISQVIPNDLSKFEVRVVLRKH